MLSHEKKRRSWAFLLCVTFFFTCVAALTFNPQLLGGSNDALAAMDVDLNDGWHTSDGVAVDLNDLNATPGFEEHGVTIQNQLPGLVYPGIGLNFISGNLTVHVYYDDTEVYAFDPNQSTYGLPYGSHFNTAPLSSSDAGKTVSLRIQPVYPDSPSSIYSLRLSSTDTYIQQFVSSHALTFVVSLMVIFIGIVILAMHVALKDERRGDLDLVALGTASILLGTWSSIVTLIPQIITGYAAVIRAIEFLSVLFAPYPMQRFAASLLQPRNRERYDKISLVISCLSIGSFMVLALVFRVDMHRLVPITRTQILLCTILIIMQCVSGYRKRGHGFRGWVRRANRRILVAFLLTLACAMLDFTGVLSMVHETIDAAFFLRIGLFVLAVVLAYEAFSTSMDYVRRANHADSVEAVAYIDALTGIGNRTAWQIMRSEVDEAMQDEAVEDVMVCMFDVNFLKRTNDSLGHAAGDDLIRRAAETINRSFGTEGACYRTGGDEFTAILVGIMLDERLVECKRLYDLSLCEQEESREGEAPLSMAFGAAKTSETKKGTIEAAQKLADKRMYDNKRAMKAQRTD